jgi:CheY-like chemotaxis protein
MVSKQILIVEDDTSILSLLSSFFDQKGYSVTAVESAEEALKQLVEADFDVAIVDIILPGMDGLHLLNEIKHVMPDTEVIIITGHASLDTSIEAVRMGAYDYFVKPFDDLHEVWFTVERAFEKRKLSANNKKLERDYRRQGEKLNDLIKRITFFRKSIQALNSDRSFSELLTYYVELITSELKVEKISIMLIDEGGEFLKIAAAHGISEDLINDFSLELGSGVSGRVASSGNPYVLQTKYNVAPQEERTDRELDFEPFHVALGLPIKNGTATVGVINVPNRPTEEPFNEQDLDLLLCIADLAGIALKNK